MTIVDWANVVLPTSALLFGHYLVRRYGATLDEWVRRFDAWFERLGRRGDTPLDSLPRDR
jgi:hypothetical protein